MAIIINLNKMKSYLQSKKFWFNALTIVTVLATALGYTPDQALAETVSRNLLVFAPIVNTVLILFFSQKGVKPLL
jgi:hypothetical protein